MSVRTIPLARPGPHWHDRFCVLQDSKDVLEGLAEARSLDEFGHAHSRAVLLFDYVQHALSVLPTKETIREILQSSLLDRLLVATSNGLRRLDQQWESPAVAGPKYLSSVQVISMLCHAVFRCHMTQAIVTANRDAVTAHVATTAVKAGKYLC